MSDLEVTVPCDGGSHRVVLREGELVLLDHDLEAERVLEAFAGRTPRCVEIAGAWHGARPEAWSSEVVAALIVPEAMASQRMARILAVSRTRATRSRPGTITRFTRRGFVDVTAELDAGARATRADAGHFVVLSRAPRPIRVAFAARHIRRCLDAWHDGAFRDLVHAGLARSLDLAATRAYASAFAREEGHLHVLVPVPGAWEMIAPGRPPRVPGTRLPGRTSPTARLPADWLLEVWLEGLGAIGDAFVLEARPVDGPGERAVSTLRWEPAGIRVRKVVRTETAVRVDGGWRVGRA